MTTDTGAPEHTGYLDMNGEGGNELYRSDETSRAASAALRNFHRRAQEKTAHYVPKLFRAPELPRRAPNGSHVALMDFPGRDDG